MLCEVRGFDGGENNVILGSDAGVKTQKTTSTLMLNVDSNNV